MSSQKTPQEATYFKIKFSKTVIILCIAVFALCGVGIGLSAWRIVRFGVHQFSDVLKYPFLIAVCLFCIALVVSILVKSQYVVDDKHFTTQFGFIKTKFVIKDITSLILNTEAKKLTVYFGEQYTVISVAPEWNEVFVRALLAANPDIDYSFTLADAPNEEKKDKDDK